MKKQHHYLIITKNTAEICDSWENVQKILKENPGPEFHKKFKSKEEAEEYAKNRMKSIIHALEWGINPYKE